MKGEQGMNILENKTDAYNIEIKTDNSFISHVFIDGKEILCTNYCLKHVGNGPILLQLEILCQGNVAVSGILSKESIKTKKNWIKAIQSSLKEILLKLHK